MAPLAMQSKLVAHAVTGECSGDCRVDGCSLERSAAHTCCCWQKKQHKIVDSHHNSNADVSDTHSAPPTKVSKGSSGCTAQAEESASTDKQRLSGLRIAAFSQLTKDLVNDPSKQFELIDAMADDLSDDGVLDGKKQGSAVNTASGTAIPEDISNRFVAALVAFQASTV